MIKPGTTRIDSPCRISISRALSGGGDKPWSVSIADDRSGVTVVSVKFTDVAFAQLMSGRADVECEGEIIASEHFGMKYENERIFPKVPGSRMLNDEAFGTWQDVLQADMDTDGAGWNLMRDDSWNGHRMDGKGNYRFNIYRYVPWEGD